MKKQLFYLMTITVVLLSGCSDINNPVDNGDNTPKEARTLLLLNEGSMGHNNSSLSKYDLSEKELVKDYFLTVNKRGLGDVGNDMLQYGAKIYVVVNKSSTIEVMDATTGISVRQIAMKTAGGEAKEPRRIAARGGKVYVTSFDDTVTRIDTLTLAIEGSVIVGQDPEGIAIVNNKIYVTNSGGLNWENGYDKTVSIIDVTSFIEEEKIEIGVNPGALQTDSEGDLYVAVSGDYTEAHPSTFRKINTSNGEVTTVPGIDSPFKFVIVDNKAYIINGSYGEPNSVIVYDCLNEKIITDSFISDGTSIEIMNNITVDPFSGDMFIAETDYINPGNLHCFDKNGKLKYSLTAVGLNPSVVVIQ